MLFRFGLLGLLAVIVITVAVSLVPLPSEALEVHEAQEYWVEEPLPETPPRPLLPARSDASLTDALERGSVLGPTSVIPIGRERPPLLRHLATAVPASARGPDPGHRPRSALSSRPSSETTDPF